LLDGPFAQSSPSSVALKPSSSMLYCYHLLRLLSISISISRSVCLVFTVFGSLSFPRNLCLACLTSRASHSSFFFSFGGDAASRFLHLLGSVLSLSFFPSTPFISMYLEHDPRAFCLRRLPFFLVWPAPCPPPPFFFPPPPLNWFLLLFFYFHPWSTPMFFCVASSGSLRSPPALTLPPQHPPRNDPWPPLSPLISISSLFFVVLLCVVFVLLNLPA